MPKRAKGESKREQRKENYGEKEREGEKGEEEQG